MFTLRRRHHEFDLTASKRLEEIADEVCHKADKVQRLAQQLRRQIGEDVDEQP